MPSLIDVRRRIRAVKSTLQLTKAMKMVERKYAFIAGGFAEIVTDRVSVLAPVAERAEDIDLARAEAAKRRAEAQLTKTGAASAANAERARLALLRALMRLQVSTRQPRMRG